MVPTWAFQRVTNVADGLIASLLPSVAHVRLGGNIGSRCDGAAVAAGDFNGQLARCALRGNSLLFALYTRRASGLARAPRSNRVLP